MTSAIRICIALLALGVVTIGVFGVLSGLNYSDPEQRSLATSTPTWVFIGMATGAAITGLSLIGLVLALVKRKAERA